MLLGGRGKGKRTLVPTTEEEDVREEEEDDFVDEPISDVVESQKQQDLAMKLPSGLGVRRRSTLSGGDGENFPSLEGDGQETAMDADRGPILPFSIEDPDSASFADDNSNERLSPAVYLFAACASWNSCILGYDLGINSLSVMLVQSSLGLSDGQIETYLGALGFFSILGAASASFVNDWLGRRGSFVVAALGFLVGDVIQSLAKSYEALLIGRAILGVSVGYGLAIDPIYISEIAPANCRGELVSWSEVAINVGVLLGFATGMVLSKIPDDQAWRYMFGVGALLPLTMLVLVKFVMPESPRWLIQKRKDEQAQRVLSRLFPHRRSDAMVHQIRQSIEEEERKQHQELGWKFLLLHPTPAYRRMLWAGVIAGVSQQAVGIDGVSSFLTYVMDQSGITNRFDQASTMSYIWIGKVLVTYFAAKLVDTVGRRKLCFVSLAGMIASLLVLAWDFESFSEEGKTASRKSFWTILGLLGYLAFFGIGMGPCAWLIPSEVFTTPIRAKGMSLCTLCNRIASMTMSASFLTLEKAITWSGVFGVLALLCTLVGVLIYKYVPETKGKSLEEMAGFFATITGDATILNQDPRITTTSGGEGSDTLARPT